MKFKQRRTNLIAAFIIAFLTLQVVIAQNKNALKDPAMNETSGIAASHINKNIFYVHNDSGDTSRFFAITPNGDLKETFYYKKDTTQKHVDLLDCEDIAVGPGVEKDKSYIYLGDIGDNSANRGFITVYRFEEPVVNGTKTVSSIKADAINLKYPDGAHDAEALMIDPVDKLLYIITKREDSVGVYTAPLNASLKEITVMQKRTNLHFSGLPLFKWITAGDISVDGNKILIKSYQKVYYWKRNKDEPVWKTLQRKPAELHYSIEKQGEAIGFTLNEKGYYTVGEGKNASIFYYQAPQ